MTKAYIVSEQMFDYDDSYYHLNGRDPVKIFHNKISAESFKRAEEIKWLRLYMLPSESGCWEWQLFEDSWIDQDRLKDLASVDDFLGSFAEKFLRLFLSSFSRNDSAILDLRKFLLDTASWEMILLDEQIVLITPFVIREIEIE